MTIAFIGFGEAGGILAADLAREHAVTIWDCKLNGPEREAMLRKAPVIRAFRWEIRWRRRWRGPRWFFYCDRR